MNNNTKIVHIVHAIDTEGPLYESLLETFLRLEHLFNLTEIPHTIENLEKLRNKKINLNGIEEHVAKVLGSHLLNYNKNWNDIDKMLARILDKAYLNKEKDSFGNGWIFNWHCLDHVGYKSNPRRRDMGYHNIYDYYKDKLKEYNINNNTIHWHFHPMSTYYEAHRCATSYVNSPELYQILCRKIIERNWFPSVFRAGFQAERPDSHWFLEQWIPFDISNMALDDNKELDNTTDFKNGRSGNWRSAVSDWSIYNPSHDDYQIKGNCRRWIGRALNILNRIASIDESEMDKAFKRADQGLPTLLGLASHDFRNLETEVDYVRELINMTKSKYPDVKFKFCNSLDGFRNYLGYSETNIEPIKLKVVLNKNPKNDVPNISIKTIRGKVFGPQPFLAIQTKSNRFIHDNLDFSTNAGEWSYAFHEDTLPLEDISNIGVACNDKYGAQFIETINL